MTFQVEFEKRLRRVLGVTDDSVSVYYESEVLDIPVFDTFNPDASYSESRIIVSSGIKSKTFGDLSELMRELDKVEL